MELETNLPAITRFLAGVRGFFGWLDRYRIRISLAVFTSLIARDVISGMHPHGIFATLDWQSVVGALSILLGLALRSWAAGTLHKMEELTQAGPYQLVRHPLYVGSFLIMIGFCLAIGDVINFCIVLGPMVALYALKIYREEVLLAKRFGDQWTEYARRTPRFIPRRWTHILGRWDARQWHYNREFQAVVGVVAGLVAIRLWNLFAA